MLKSSGEEPRLSLTLFLRGLGSRTGIISRLTRSNISETLIGRKDSEITLPCPSGVKDDKVQSTPKGERTGGELKKVYPIGKGILNPFYRKEPGIKALDIAAEKAGTKIYVYDIKKFSLVKQ